MGRGSNLAVHEIIGAFGVDKNGDWLVFEESVDLHGLRVGDDSRIRLRLRRKATATSRVVAVAEGEAAQRQRALLEVRVVRYGEMVAAKNCCCRGGLGCGCVVAMRAASGGGGLRGCAEEQRVMAAGATAGCSGRGEKEAEEATVAAKVAGKRRKQQPTMGGSGGCRPELAAAAVKKVGGWLRLQGRGWAALEGEETTALDPTVGSGGGGDAGEGRHD
ncbi:hypothetical protein BHM03_00032445 [Ensete ventricosum]|nr:hypothetical protein BHM03_00032445 [Ensete ventricosum]